MTEVKWGIIFISIFLCLVLGLEFRCIFLREVTGLELNLNMQLDTCLEDTLLYTDYSLEEGISFANPENTGDLLWKNLFRALDVPEEQKAILLEKVAIVFLYEEKGFYYYGKDSGSWIWQDYQEKSLEYQILQMEAFIEKETGLSLTFPKNEEDKMANSLDGTGILMLFRPNVARVDGQEYNRLILSGAKVENLW